MFELFNLTVGYEKKSVVEGINLEIEKGQIVALLGPNGAGKSTILKSISALLPPLKGEIFIKGQNLSHVKINALSKILAVVLTERLNAGFLTVFDVVAMGRYPHTSFLGKLTIKDKEKVQECLQIVNAENLALRYFNELSDGEKQKVLLARALAQEPELIILDEPTTHLDVRHKLEIMNILKSLSREKGITVIFSLHEIELALKSCDIAVLIKGSKVVSIGAPEKVGNKEAISDLYDIDCAGYSALMGTTEIFNKIKPSAFVVGGAGKATGIYRLLTRHNIGFCTGVIHENDVDCHIAEMMGVNTVKEKAFENIGPNAYREAQNILSNISMVIDTGFPIADSNRFNQNLIMDALGDKKTVLSLRNEKESKTIYGDDATQMIHCKTPWEIIQYCTEKKVY